MERIEFSIHDDVESTNSLWKEFRAIVESEGWKSDDHSVMEITPVISSTRSVYAQDKDGKFVGCVIWNEYDNIAFIGFYLMKEQYRGMGIGPVLWKRALGRMPKDYAIGLRAVPYMTSRYKSRDTPVEGQTLTECRAQWQQISEIFEKKENTNADVRLVSTLKQEDYQKLELFDKNITKRDRSDFLKRFHALPFTEGSCIFNEKGDVTAYASITSTSTAESHLFKLAPIYANSLTDALTVARPLIAHAGKRDPKATILVHILGGTRGEQELFPLLISADVPSRLVGVTLFSKPYPNNIDFNQVYIAFNNSCHFDA